MIFSPGVVCAHLCCSLCFASIGCTVHKARVPSAFTISRFHHSHDVKVVIRIACDCNCRPFRIPFDAILCLLASISNGVMAFLLLPTHFFSSRRRRHRVVVAFVRSNGDAVAATLNVKVMARDRAARSIFALQKLCLSADIKYNKFQRATFSVCFSHSARLLHRLDAHPFAHMRQTIRFRVRVSRKMLISDTMPLPHCCH